MYLTQSIDYGKKPNKMVGIFDAETKMSKKMKLNYTKGKMTNSNILSSKKHVFQGHEFHYSSIIEQPDTALFSVTDANGQIVAETGSVRAQVSGTFFHLIAEA